MEWWTMQMGLMQLHPFYFSLHKRSDLSDANTVGSKDPIVDNQLRVWKEQINII